MKRIGIVAGNYQQFTHFIEYHFKDKLSSYDLTHKILKVEDDHYHYLHSERQLRGMRYDKIILYGTFHDSRLMRLPARQLMREICSDIVTIDADGKERQRSYV